MGVQLSPNTSNFYFLATATDTEIHLVAVVIDATPMKKIASQGGPALLERTLDAIISFGNAHLMQSSLNKLAVLVCNSYTT